MFNIFQYQMVGDINDQVRREIFLIDFWETGSVVLLDTI